MSEQSPAVSRRLIWQALRIAAPITVVVVPFGYATAGARANVLMGVGCGLAFGVGVGLRGGPRGGPWTGILVGAIVGIATALLVGGLPFNGMGWLLPPILALAVGLIDGLGASSLSGYRDVTRETLVMSAMLALGLLPSRLMLVGFIWSLWMLALLLLLTPWIVLVAGLLSQHREGWRDPRPPRWLLLAAAVLPPVMVLGLLDEGFPLSQVAWQVPFMIVAIPASAFLLGRTAMTWLQPRLRVYGRLADYLRVMWVPIGGFAVGYVTIIVVFAGFYGMLEHFQPGAFAGAATGISEWLSFAFFTAIAQDYATVSPVSMSARLLVGTHLILSVGWALVLFAAVMSSIQPRLERIARRDAEEGGD